MSLSLFIFIVLSMCCVHIHSTQSTLQEFKIRPFYSLFLSSTDISNVDVCDVSRKVEFLQPLFIIQPYYSPFGSSNLHDPSTCMSCEAHMMSEGRMTTHQVQTSLIPSSNIIYIPFRGHSHSWGPRKGIIFKFVCAHFQSIWHQVTESRVSVRFSFPFFFFFSSFKTLIFIYTSSVTFVIYVLYLSLFICCLSSLNPSLSLSLLSLTLLHKERTTPHFEWSFNLTPQGH